MLQDFLKFNNNPLKWFGNRIWEEKEALFLLVLNIISVILVEEQSDRLSFPSFLLLFFVKDTWINNVTELYTHLAIYQP